MELINNLGSIAIIGVVLYLARDLIFTLLGKVAKKQVEEAQKKDNEFLKEQERNKDKAEAAKANADKLQEEMDALKIDKDWYKK